MGCTRPRGHGGYTHTSVSSWVHSPAYLCSVFCNHFVLFTFQRAPWAGRPVYHTVDQRGDQCKERYYRYEPWKMQWSCLLSLQIWRYPGMSCYHLMLWFSADDLCLVHQSMAVLFLLWKWMYTSRIRDVVTWVIHPLPVGWLHDWHGEIAGWYGKITDMLNNPLADRHCFTNCGVETTGKKGHCERSRGNSNHSEKILSGPIPYGVAWCFAAGMLFCDLNNLFTYHWNENQYF